MQAAVVAGFAAAAVPALAYGVVWAGRDDVSAARSAVKTAGVALLAVVGLYAGAVWTVTLGLALGALGDFALSRAGRGWFLAGMAAFAGGHLAYALAFAGAALAAGAPPLPWAALGLLALLLASTELWLAPRTGDLRGPVRGYVVVIGLMAAAALLVPGGPGRGLLLTGAAAFVASDLILALRLFVLRDEGAKGRAGLLLWPLYAGGQALILAGALAAGGCGAHIGPCGGP